MLFATVALVLIIASANVAALLLARAIARQREIAVRSALGASPARIARQLLTEGVVLALLGGVGGIAVASLAPLIARLPPLSGMPRFDQVAVDWRVAAFAFGIAGLTGILVMLAPLAELSRRRGTFGREVLRLTGRPRGVIRASRVLVAQIAVTAGVLVVAATLARGFATLLGGDPGFRSAGVLTMRTALPPKYRTAADITRFYDSALERIRTIAGVESAAAITQLPLSGAMLGSRFTLGGLLLGVPLAFAAGALVHRTLPGVSAIDPILLIASGLALVVTTTAACWLPARRASRVPPSEPLRDSL